MYWLILALLASVFSGCSNSPYRGKNVVGADEFVIDSYKIREGKFAILEMEGIAVEKLSQHHLEEYQDRIRSGDVLKIVLYHPTRHDLIRLVSSISESIGFKVSSQGIILPEIGRIEVVGLTLDEGREKIQAAYRKEMYDVDVFVDYSKRIEGKIELAGLVQIPSLCIDGRMRLYEALSLAKIPPEANLFKSYMIRDGTLLAVDFYKLLKEGDMQQNVVLQGGDKIYIADAAASSLMVLGEVGKERAIHLPNGFMTLREAIAEAGGMTPSGDRAYVQIIRGNLIQPKIYTLHWKHVSALPSGSMLLIPGDIVYVAATPITEWSRFVSQILPTLIGLDLLSKGLKGVGVNVP